MINDELERHLESMYNALGEIDSRQRSKVVHQAGVIMMSALIGVFANCQSWNEVADFSAERIALLKVLQNSSDLSHLRIEYSR